MSNEEHALTCSSRCHSPDSDSSTGFLFLFIALRCSRINWSTGFSNLAFLKASVFRTARLLPPTSASWRVSADLAWSGCLYRQDLLMGCRKRFFASMCSAHPFLEDDRVTHNHNRLSGCIHTYILPLVNCCQPQDLAVRGPLAVTRPSLQPIPLDVGRALPAAPSAALLGPLLAFA